MAQIKIKKIKEREPLPEDLLNKDEVLRILRVAEHPMHKAMVTIQNDPLCSVDARWCLRSLFKETMRLEACPARCLNNECCILDSKGMLMKFSVLVERDEDGYYIASVPELPSCHTQARTLDELTSRIKEAIELYLETEGSRAEGKVELIGVQFVEVQAE